MHTSAQTVRPVRGGAPVPFGVWERAGLTEHMGGVGATERLLARCQVAAGQRVLDLGCGTGYTATLLAARYQARVTALDLNPALVGRACERVGRAGVSGRVGLLRADGHALPLAEASFDLVVVESVLVFCAAPQVLTEIWRVLRPGGRLGLNELTLRRPPSPALLGLLDSLSIHPRTEQEWRGALERSGLTASWVAVAPLSLRAQLGSHLRVDGPRVYLAALARGLADPALRQLFCTRAMLWAACQFLPDVGYGLYVATKQ
jgi:SAM-dependent methyltransferase